MLCQILFELPGLLLRNFSETKPNGRARVGLAYRVFCTIVRDQSYIGYAVFASAYSAILKVGGGLASWANGNVGTKPIGRKGEWERRGIKGIKRIKGSKEMQGLYALRRSAPERSQFSTRAEGFRVGGRIRGWRHGGHGFCSNVGGHGILFLFARTAQLERFAGGKLFDCGQRAIKNRSELSDFEDSGRRTGQRQC